MLCSRRIFCCHTRYPLDAGKEVSDAAGGGETAFAGVAAISASTAANVPPATKKLRLDNRWIFPALANHFSD
jgi:hypothetical protein